MKKGLLILAAIFTVIFTASCSMEPESGSSVLSSESFETSTGSIPSESSSSRESPTISDNFNLSYEEYFSKERKYVDASMVSFDASYYNYGISEKGNLYRVSHEDNKRHDRERYFNFFTVDGNVVDFDIDHDELAFVVDGRTIFSSNLDGTEAEIVFELPKEIEGKITGDFFVSPELFWFRIGPTVYRVHRPSGTLDKIYTNEDIIIARPLSNYSIEYFVYDPRWIEHLANGGNELDWVPYSPQITYIYNSETGEDYEAQYSDEEPYGLIYDIE